MLLHNPLLGAGVLARGALRLVMAVGGAGVGTGAASGIRPRAALGLGLR